MGCDGLKYTSMAEAFIEKGAKVYISWNGPVSARHTDQTTAQLLKHLLAEKETIKEAVAETMKAVGQDPEFNESTLLYYPRTLDIDNYAILNHTSEFALVARARAEAECEVQVLLSGGRMTKMSEKRGNPSFR